MALEQQVWDILWSLVLFSPLPLAWLLPWSWQLHEVLPLAWELASWEACKHLVFSFHLFFWFALCEMLLLQILPRTWPLQLVSSLLLDLLHLHSLGYQPWEGLQGLQLPSLQLLYFCEATTNAWEEDLAFVETPAVACNLLPSLRNVMAGSLCGKYLANSCSSMPAVAWPTPDWFIFAWLFFGIG